MIDSSRRGFLKTLGAGSLLALPGRAISDHAGPGAGASNLCGPGGKSQPLYVPSASGFLARLPLDEPPLLLSAAAAAPGNPAPQGLSEVYLARFDGRDYVNPTLVLRANQDVKVDFVNRINEATIVHWHGLAVDARNDGGGMAIAAPGERFAYDFRLASRGALYWYHPHPHGLTAGQAYRGLFGMLEVTDDDEGRLRAALDLVPGKSEVPLLLQDRRAGSDYAASEAERMHGFLGDTVLVNGTACPYLDVATRIYRFRVLNASNARTYLLGWRTAAGKPVPFTLIGNDGGLLSAPRTCSEAFLASAERLDILLDLSDLDVGETLVLETRGFDPMHMESAAGSPAVDHAAMGHAAGTADPHAEHAAHGGPFPEGAPRALLQLRVREKLAYRGRVPSSLSSPKPIAVARASERALRLGFAKGHWRINDRVFAMGETPIEVRRGAVETWLIRNYFNSMPHAMHLHGFHFEVLERQTSPDQVAALKIDDRGRLATDLGRKDTVLVWPGETVRVAVDFTLPAAAAYAGDQIYMFHCHNLEHEDGGMMLGVRVT